MSTKDLVVVLDVETTPELEAEGVRNDVVRLVQQARRDAGLHVSDRIALAVDTDAATAAAIRAHAPYVQEQVLATSLAFGAPAAGAFVAEGKVGSGAGTSVRVGVAKT